MINVKILNFCYNRLKGGGSYDQKQHLNLSHQAWIKIDDDINNFIKDSNHNLSGFLNTVFENFYEEALASISYQMDKANDELDKMFADPLFDKYNKQTKHDFINKTITVYKNNLLETVSKYPKGEGRKFRINNRNMD